MVTRTPVDGRKAPIPAYGPIELIEWVKAQARKNGRSFSGQVVYLLQLAKDNDNGV